MGDLQAVLDAYLDDELTDRQHRDLTAWIAADLGNVDRFVSQCCLDSYLQDVFGGERLARNAMTGGDDAGLMHGKPHQRQGERTADRGPQDRDLAARGNDVSMAPLLPEMPPALGGQFSQGSWFLHTLGYSAQGWALAYLVATVVLGIGLMVAAVMPVSPTVQVARKASLPAAQRPQASEPEIRSVGRVTGMVECEWAGHDRAQVGCAVALSRKFAIRSGLLEISYDSGAKVILDGPATYEVDSTSGGYLSIGKLTAKVDKGLGIRDKRSDIPHPLSLIPHPVFVVRTPTATVTDLGTEFGVETDGNVTQSYVYQGLVEVAPRAGGGAAAKIRLHEQQSVAIDRSGAVLPRQVVSGKQFVRRLAIRPFGGSPDLAEGTEVFCQRFDADSVDLAADYPGLVYGPGLPSTGKAAGDTAVVSGGALRLSHQARADHTESVMTVREFSGRMIVSVDIGAEGMSINMSHVGLCLGDRTFVIHPGFSKDGVRGAFRIKKAGRGRTKDNTDMGFVPHCNLMHHLFVYYDGASTFHVCLIDAANSRNVFRTTVVDRKCPRTFSIGVCRSGSMRMAMFDNLRVVQLPVDKNDNPLKRQ